MNTIVWTSALIVFSLCKADAMLGLLFGLSVSISVLFTAFLIIITEKHADEKVRLFWVTVFSICMGTAFSRCFGSAFSGEADNFFSVVSGIASSIVSFICFHVKSTSVGNILKNVLPIVPISFGIGALREVFGEGSIFGEEIKPVSEYTVSSLGAYCGGLLISAVFIGISLIVCKRLGGKNGA